MTNHLWQSTLFAIAAGVLAVALRKNRAQVRYWLWLSASLKFLVPFSLLMSLGSQLEWAPADQTLATPVLVIEQIAQPFPETAPLMQSRPGSIDWTFAAWACGFAAIALIRLRGWLRIRAAIRSSKPVRHALACRLQVRSSPRLLEPGVVGFWNPILLLPAGIEDHLTPSQLEAVLAHELCHVRRRDNLFASIHMIVEAVFWFHPLVWWIGSRLVEERERACDEEVLSLGNEPRVYAEGILNVCKLYVESPLTCVSGVTGSDIKKRIEAIMSNPAVVNLNFAKKALLAAVGIVALAAPIVVGITNAPRLQAQAAATPKFDVASIKLNQSGAKGGGMGFRPGRFDATNASLLQLIAQAYGIQAFGTQDLQNRIMGAPKWSETERYNIAARTEQAVSQETTMLMAQKMLEERFQLKIHKETKEMPIYALVIGKTGSKLKPNTDQGQGDVSQGAVAGKYRLTARKMPIYVLASMLENRMDRVIVDRTGLDGDFDFHLEWALDLNDNSAPSIFSAVQEQLGLRLESTKGPVDVIVIDSVEHPSEN